MVSIVRSLAARGSHPCIPLARFKLIGRCDAYNIVTNFRALIALLETMNIVINITAKRLVRAHKYEPVSNNRRFDRFC